MARPLRIDILNGLYHVASRGLERGANVYQDRDREHWHELLDRVATRRRHGRLGPLVQGRLRGSLVESGGPI